MRTGNVPVGEWVKGDDRSLDRVRCSDCNRICRVPTTLDRSTRMVTEKLGGKRMDVGWEILSVLAPVVCVALLGLIVLYALSRVPRRPQ